VAYEQLIVDLDGAVATVRMNNPGKLNALSRTLTGELLDALERLRDDASVRAVVLTGEGRGFCSGADLGALRDRYERGERPKPSIILRDGYNRLIALLSDVPKPVVAAINGVAAGAGVSVALACDFRIASADATFSTAFVRIGLIPDSGASYFLPRTIGLAKALELSLTGERIDADTAQRIGLVTRVVPADAVGSEAAALAGRLSELPTAATGLIKRIFRETNGLSLPEALEREADFQDMAASTADHLEGVMAFLEKRPPAFTGR
jgi:2-(1,2-epoxy-1,2-dihydrophenyl)acetyl-CoA isomerase